MTRLREKKEKTMHECEDCGMFCDCDGEDLVGPQPPDCVHLAGPGYCDANEEPMSDDEEPSEDPREVGY